MYQILALLDCDKILTASEAIKSNMPHKIVSTWGVSL